MKKLLMLIALIGLTACHMGKRYIYTYVPPTSPMGKYCVSQCVEKKNLCVGLCQVKIDHCKTREQENAYYRYQMYHDDRVARGLPARRMITDFDHSKQICCQSLCDCKDRYNLCYLDCGGVITRRFGTR